jgi:aminopeptidase N
MENASCIFYHERSVTGRQENELLFAHEIAHQWYGDAVSELNWHHIWLSEGFATYLTDIYIEQTYGREAFVSSLLDEKEQVLRFARRKLAPIVDTSLSVSVSLLNKNTYEKAAWVLHMLRHDMGDEKFQECVKIFYEKYKYRNALTEDFKELVESVTGKSYETFFNQWFYKSGHPLLSMKWKTRGKKTILTISQHQEHHVFEFPLDIELTNSQGDTFRGTLIIRNSSHRFSWRTENKITNITLDPDTNLLFEYYNSP